jgi:predicted transcriptional regulator
MNLDVMQMVNRDRHDLAAEILDKSTARKNKTEIMQSVGLSSLQAKQYLGKLVEIGMLEVDMNRDFKTTKKGLEFLEKCEECFLCHWHRQREAKSPSK